ncbi:glycoside hydrolase family 3 N-terminal domain-containing protein [Microcella sp.]|uniref:glycoside hydrolase family 3 N-terminal domain-containing protein n=1 Tax=Microcella sp. TaxID=1913979 RepID=UPI00299F72E9|nr:glycoside hydrolase family 3 N-terminal domain-containing protein [Microcella sp.]MDX2025062.1 glycoside hydrolase family 3 N-terminal domain-containing protein [Microcella sp.]
MRRRHDRSRAIAVVGALIAVSLGGCSIAPIDAVPAQSRLVGAPAPLDVDQVYRDQRIAAMTPEQKLAALVMIHVPGTDAGSIRAVIDAHGLGGVILMGDNVAGPASSVAALTAGLSTDAGLPVLTAIDQEGGTVRRLDDDRALAARDLWGLDPSATEQAFAARSALVASAGVMINFGIVADVTPDRSSFIRPRTLGETPSAAAERVAAAVRGEMGVVLSTLKHFPGHGASPDDSHVSIPRSNISLETWRTTHAVPFQAGIDAGAPLVMMGHLQFDQISPMPASLSPAWIDILRSEMGFDGVIVTDDLLMLQASGVPAYANPTANAIAALAAGNDVVLFVLPGDPSTVGVNLTMLISDLAAALDDGRLDPARIDESLDRVLAIRRDASGQSAPYVDCGLKCWGQSPRSLADDN